MKDEKKVKLTEEEAKPEENGMELTEKELKQIVAGYDIELNVDVYQSEGKANVSNTLKIG